MVTGKTRMWGADNLIEEKKNKSGQSQHLLQNQTYSQEGYNYMILCPLSYHSVYKQSQNSFKPQATPGS